MKRDADSNLCKHVRSNRLGLEYNVMIRKYNQLPEPIKDPIVGKETI